MRMFSSSENCARTPPAAREVEPDAERRPLEQQHVAHARLGEVERDAGTDHPAADDHDVGRRGKRGGH